MVASPRPVDILEKNKHISTVQVLEDIGETEREIREMTAEAEHLEATPATSQDYRLNNYIASAKRTGIEDRQKFVENLRKLIYARTEAGEKLSFIIERK